MITTEPITEMLENEITPDEMAEIIDRVTHMYAIQSIESKRIGDDTADDIYWMWRLKNRIKHAELVNS